MAIIKCPECQSEVSDKAEACPKCGYSFKEAKKKERQRKNRKGCLVLFLFCIVMMIWFCSSASEKAKERMEAQANSSAPAVVKKETELDRYEKRMEACFIMDRIGHNRSLTTMRTHFQNQLKRELLSPKSYESLFFNCDYPKTEADIRDTLLCVNKYNAKNAFGVDLEKTATLEFVIPPYNPNGYSNADRCKMRIISLE